MNCISQLGQNVQLLSSSGWGVSRWGDTFWLQNDTLTFEGEAYQSTAIYWIEMSRIPPNFDTVFVTSYKLFGNLKGSLHNVFISRSTL
jgi:hypothetical protein